VPYLKCVACKIRVSEAGAKTDLTTGMCPGCGEPLEPAGPLAELVGFRSPNLHDRSVPPPVAARVIELDAGSDGGWPHDRGVFAAAIAARAQYQAP
jgi:hypothetical protein